MHEKGVSCEKLWIMRKMNTLQTKKPPSGGPRSPCICVANTARAGAASLARASKQKSRHQAAFLSSGDGRTRTAVQPNHQYAFYMLILSLIVGNRLPKDRLPETYPLGLGVL